LSVGYRYAAFGSPSGNTGPSVAYDAIKCATVGLSIERFPFAPGMDASFRAAWIPLNIFDDQVRFAGDFDLSFRYRIMNLKDKLSLYASAGSVTTVIVAAGGSEVGELLYASIGVALNE